MSVDNTDDEENVVIEAPINTYKPSPSTAVYVVVTIAPIYIK